MFCSQQSVCRLFPLQFYLFVSFKIVPPSVQNPLSHVSCHFASPRMVGTLVALTRGFEHTERGPQIPPERTGFRVAISTSGQSSEATMAITLLFPTIILRPSSQAKIHCVCVWPELLGNKVEETELLFGYFCQNEFFWFFWFDR